MRSIDASTSIVRYAATKRRPAHHSPLARRSHYENNDRYEIGITQRARRAIARRYRRYKTPTKLRSLFKFSRPSKSRSRGEGGGSGGGGSKKSVVRAVQLFRASLSGYFSLALYRRPALKRSRVSFGRFFFRPRCSPKFVYCDINPGRNRISLNCNAADYKRVNCNQTVKEARLRFIAAYPRRRDARRLRF